jgi:hypothetical protein
MFAVAALVICNKACYRERITFRFREVDDLAIGVGLKRCECSQEINGFQNAGLALRIAAYQHDNPPGDVYIQAGKVAEVCEGEVFEIHGLKVEG